MKGKTVCGGRPRKMAAAGVLAAAIAAFAQAPTERVPWRPDIPPGLDLYLPVPEDNPLTPEKVALGGKLFNDHILSRDQSMACATCHNPKRAFTDAQPVAIGVLGRKGTRRVPVLINRGYGAAFFWDGRASSLEEQVLQPIQNPIELGMSLKEVVERLKENQKYRQAFQSAFGADVNALDLARALASYVRTILSGDSPLDRYSNGEADALSPEARRGLEIFRGKGNCTVCHLGPNFTDEHFHNTGVAWRKGKLLDHGRFRATGKETDRGAFKTPTLREVARTAPYMHDGSLATLDQVIEFYNRGGNPNPYLDPELHPLKLTPEEKQALSAFLKALSGTVLDGGLK